MDRTRRVNGRLRNDPISFTKVDSSAYLSHHNAVSSSESVHSNHTSSSFTSRYSSVHGDVDVRVPNYQRVVNTPYNGRRRSSRNNKTEDSIAPRIFDWDDEGPMPNYRRSRFNEPCMSSDEEDGNDLTLVVSSNRWSLWRAFTTVAYFLAVPFYWIVMQAFTLEKWLLNKNNINANKVSYLGVRSWEGINSILARLTRVRASNFSSMSSDEDEAKTNRSSLDYSQREQTGSYYNSCDVNNTNNAVDRECAEGQSWVSRIFGSASFSLFKSSTLTATALENRAVTDGDSDDANSNGLLYTSWKTVKKILPLLGLFLGLLLLLFLGKSYVSVLK